MKPNEFREKYKEIYKLKKIRESRKKNVEEVIVKKNDYSFLYNSINKNVTNTLNNKELKIIGITGSKGKSTVCYLLHNALKLQGKKSVLYSSIEIDSELSYVMKGAIENPLKNKEMLLNAVNEAIENDADYLILEVNERAINNHIVDDLDFDLKVVTNIMAKHNNFLYKNYEEIKKSFLLDNNAANTKLLLGVTNPETVDLYNRLDNKIVFTTEFYMDHYNIKQVDYLLKPNNNVFDSLNGLNFDIYDRKNNKTNIQSNLFMTYNALNIGLVYSILNELNEYNKDKFNELINNIIIPGRNETFKFNNKTIIISYGLDPELANIKEYKNKGLCNNIIVVTGASGLGYKTWLKEFSSEEYIQEKIDGMRFAYNYIEKYADKVYITVSDSGATNKLELIKYQENLVTKIPKYGYENRKYAIYKAITEASNNDVILISGRGNRKIMCDGYDSISFFLDKDAVLEIIKDLKKDTLW